MMKEFCLKVLEWSVRASKVLAHCIWIAVPSIVLSLLKSKGKGT